MDNVLNSSKEMSMEQAISQITNAYIDYLCNAALDWLDLKKVNLTAEQRKLVLMTVAEEFKIFIGQGIELGSLTMKELQSKVSSIVSAPESYKKFLATMFIDFSLLTTISCMKEMKVIRG